MEVMYNVAFDFLVLNIPCEMLELQSCQIRKEAIFLKQSEMGSTINK